MEHDEFLGDTRPRPYQPDAYGSRGRRGITLGVAALAGIALWLTSAARARPARREVVSHLAAQDRWESYVDLLDESSGSLYLTTQYAQCYTGYCTLNGDGQTASCGCLSIRPSDSVKGELQTGWVAAVLSLSDDYRKALREHNDGDSDSARTTLEDAISTGSMWDSYGFSSPPDRISLFSSAHPYDIQSSVEECSDVYAAQCMGAPCWDTPYGDSYWNVTCLCPYVSASESMASDTHKSVCEDAKEGGNCAVIGFGEGATEYSASGLKDMVEAVCRANLTIDTDKCPAKDDRRRRLT